MTRQVLVAIVLSLIAARAGAQSAALRGIVVDESGGALPGAVVVLTSGDDSNPRETTTDATGQFVVANARLGAARLQVELAGFQAANVKLAIESVEPPPLTITLKVGFDEEVTVSAEAGGSVLAPAKNANAIEFDPEALRRLPSDAQDLQALVDSFTTGGPVGGVSVIVDGVATDASGVPASAIHRLLINRNPYSAEFKSPGKSRVEVETERGSRRFYHGSGAIFFRDSALQARNAFATTTPDLTRALNEATLGGPLFQRAWSFFLSGQLLIDDGSAVINARTLAGAVIQNAATPERRDTLFSRVDFRPNKTDAITIRYDLFDDVERGHGVGGLRLSEQARTTTERRHRAQANDHRILANGVVNDLRLEAISGGRTDGAPAAAPSVVVEGAFVGGPSQVFTVDDYASLQGEDIATLSVAGRQLRIGARFKTRWTDVTDASDFAGRYQFQSLTDFARGAPFLFVRRRGASAASLATTDVDLFTEATFRPTDAVGVTAGLRYEWPSDIGDWNNLAPRTTVAYAPADRRTVYRVGAGLFYQSVPQDAIARTRLFGVGGLRETAIQNPSFPSPPAIDAAAPAATWILAPDLRLPQTMQASGAVERALWRRTSLTAEYQLLRTFNALRARDINAPVATNGVRPDRSHLNVFEIGSTGESRTNALSLTFRGRLVGFRGTIQYTLSKTIDDGSGAFDLPADSVTPTRELARADFDRRHTLSAAGSYGWRRDRVRLSGVLSIASGAPFDIVTGADTNHDLVVNDRPAGIARNAGDGPGQAQLDLRFTTVFRAPRPSSADPESAKREQTDNLELNLDLFNAFNRVNATTFVGVVTSPLFGRANAARIPRTAQVSLRYRF